MYAERISSSMFTGRTLPIRCISMPRSSPHLSESFATGARGGHVGWHPIARFELGLLRGAGTQEFALALRDDAAVFAAYLTSHVIDPAPAAGDVRFGHQPLARIGGSAEAEVHLRRYRPGVEARRGPGHHLVEECREDPAVDLLLPAHEVASRDPLRPSRPVSELDMQAHPDGVVPAAGEAVVVRERVAPAVRAGDLATGTKGAGATHH